MNMILGVTQITYPTGDNWEYETGTLDAIAASGVYVKRPVEGIGPQQEIVFVYTEDIMAIQNGNRREEIQSIGAVITRQMQDAALAYQRED